MPLVVRESTTHVSPFAKQQLQLQQSKRKFQSSEAIMVEKAKEAQANAQESLAKAENEIMQLKATVAGLTSNITLLQAGVVLAEKSGGEVRQSCLRKTLCTSALFYTHIPHQTS
jgi:uncharacterized protein HemX